MSDLIEVKIEGGDELFEKLEQLPRQVGKAIIRKAIGAGAKVFRDLMASLAPQGYHVFRTTEYKGQKFKGRSRDFGVLARSIVVRTSVRGDELEGTAAIGPSKKAFWGLFQEFGRKGARAHPFIRPAFDSGKDQALQKFVDTCKQAFDDNGAPLS